MTAAGERWDGPSRAHWEEILGPLLTREPSRVLVVSAGFGEGHNRAAWALERMLATLHPDVSVRVVDALSHGARTVQRQRNLYYAALRFCPALYARSYRLLSDLPGTLPRLSAPYRRELRAPINEFRPTIVLATHVFCAHAAQQLLSSRAVPVVGVLTDWVDDAYWNRTALDRYLVASGPLVQRLTAAGIDREKVVCSGIPVAPGFYRHQDKTRARETVGLAGDRYTVLLLGGGLGLGPVRDTAWALTRSDLGHQVIVGTGRNDELRSRIELLKLSAKVPLVAVPFTNRLDDYMRASDVVVTKPGGVTVAECLAQELPLVLLGKALPGPETLNETHLLDSGLAAKPSDLTALVRWVSSRAAGFAPP